MEGTVRSQGTELFTVDKLSASIAAMIKMACPTGITGLGGPRSQIDSTCLDTEGDQEFVGGLGQPGQVSVPFNLIPSQVSHQLLFDLKESGDVLQWMECLSEGKVQPALVNEELVAPAGRTTFEFFAFVADVNIDVATNDLVRGTLTLQRSGRVIPHWNAPAP